MTDNTLRLITDDTGSPLDRDEALRVINEHWKAARAAYSVTIGAIGEPVLRELIDPGGRHIDHWHMRYIRDRARTVARRATRMADELDLAVEAYERHAQHVEKQP